MQIFVTIPNGRQLDFDVQGVDSLEYLRKAIHDKFHPAHPHLCSLAMDGKILAEGTLADNGVMLEATLICQIRAEELLVILNVGGKRHFTDRQHHPGRAGGEHERSRLSEAAP